MVNVPHWLTNTKQDCSQCNQRCLASPCSGFESYFPACHKAAAFEKANLRHEQAVRFQMQRPIRKDRAPTTEQPPFERPYVVIQFISEFSKAKRFDSNRQVTPCSSTIISIPTTFLPPWPPYSFRTAATTLSLSGVAISTLLAPRGPREGPHSENPFWAGRRQFQNSVVLT